VSSAPPHARDIGRAYLFPRDDSYRVQWPSIWGEYDVGARSGKFRSYGAVCWTLSKQDLNDASRHIFRFRGDIESVMYIAIVLVLISIAVIVASRWFSSRAAGNRAEI
jgi:hypothetical protein